VDGIARPVEAVLHLLLELLRHLQSAKVNHRYQQKKRLSKVSTVSNGNEVSGTKYGCNE
jgi:hypothetical protein